ncbi:response regulator transcription factor [Rhizobium ruizarguesonis]|uniref:response regulator transcription factor n=1 Tax=Rhizobium ruizarguesonis TaxID=2081791 RepID=UPI0010321A17|nr:response regulator transcription factor [Rhizobium ruizarguesonis]TBE87772.1 response regulator transcription factor [Rhizobium ruizarguesonis]
MQTHSSKPIQTVFVVDDDDGMRNGIDTLVRSVGYRTSHFPSAAAFFGSGQYSEPGCLLLDVRLPGMSGLEFQELLAERGVRMPIVFMTGHGDIPMSVRTMKAGAVDFLTKPFREQDMLEALQAALNRDLKIRAELDITADCRKRYESLTSREREVLELVVQGKMNKQIAFDLGLSEITVKIHRGNAIRKMGATSIPQLVKLVEAGRLS